MKNNNIYNAIESLKTILNEIEKLYEYRNDSGDTLDKETNAILRQIGAIHQKLESDLDDRELKQQKQSIYDYSTADSMAGDQE